MKKKWLLLSSLGVGAIAIAGLPYKCDYTEYTIENNKIKNPIRLIMLSDLHGTSYGNNMNQLVSMIQQAKGDAILIPGDLFDEFHGDENAFNLLEQIKDYPIFYTTGNHEEHRRDVNILLNKIKEYGVNILDYSSKNIELNGNLIEIGGISCKYREGNYLVEEVNKTFQSDNYRILLSHKPHWISLYKKIDCDLVVSGHAHGGQWCIPTTKVGVAAPQQGLFPKYIEGIHDLDNKKIVIGRGLTKDYHGIPRLYNNPEFIVINLLPKVSTEI